MLKAIVSIVTAIVLMFFLVFWGYLLDSIYFGAGFNVILFPMIGGVAFIVWTIKEEKAEIIEALEKQKQEIIEAIEKQNEQRRQDC